MTGAVTALASAEQSEPAFWYIHRGHLLLLGTWIVVVGVISLRTTVRRRSERSGTPAQLRRSAWVWAAAVAAVVSGGVHLTVIGEHFGESALYGSFFLVLCAVQFGWAGWLLLRPATPVLFAGAAASVLVALLWLATRTVGIPLGPEAGEKEAFGGLDIIASSAEVLVAVFAVAALRLRTRGAAASGYVSPNAAVHSA
jgi:hypothetical protein